MDTRVTSALSTARFVTAGEVLLYIKVIIVGANSDMQ
jgi:hypothetical protein